MEVRCGSCLGCKRSRVQIPAARPNSSIELRAWICHPAAKHTILVFDWRIAMSRAGRAEFVLLASAASIAILGAAAQAQQTRYPKPTELPNPYRLVGGWPNLPTSMNGGHWGEVIRVHVSSDGNIWVFHRCFNTVPPWPRHLHRPGRFQSADFGIRSIGQASEKLWRGIVRLSSRLHNRRGRRYFPLRNSLRPLVNGAARFFRRNGPYAGTRLLSGIARSPDPSPGPTRHRPLKVKFLSISVDRCALG